MKAGAGSKQKGKVHTGCQTNFHDSTLLHLTLYRMFKECAAYDFCTDHCGQHAQWAFMIHQTVLLSDTIS